MSSGEVECYEAYGMEGNDIFYYTGNPRRHGNQGLWSYGVTHSIYWETLPDMLPPPELMKLMVDHDLDLIKGTLIIERGCPARKVPDCVLVAGVTLPRKIIRLLAMLPQ